jgi:hypothetical protein
MLNRQLEHADGCTCAARNVTRRAAVESDCGRCGNDGGARCRYRAPQRMHTQACIYTHTHAHGTVCTHARTGAHHVGGGGPQGQRRRSGVLEHCISEPPSPPQRPWGAATEGSRPPPGRHYAAEGAAGGPPRVGQCRCLWEGKSQSVRSNLNVLQRAVERGNSAP